MHLSVFANRNYAIPTSALHVACQNASLDAAQVLLSESKIHADAVNTK